MGTNVVTSGCFKIEFTDKNPINLGDSVPITDEDGVKLIPYKVTITNACDSYARYQVNLEILSETSLMNHKYIKAMYNDDTPQILTSYNQVKTTLANATDSYKLEIGYLDINESKTINLRLWLDEETPLSEDTMNKQFMSKITVTTSYVDKIPSTLKVYSASYKDGMRSYKDNITKVVIQNELKPIENAVLTSDESLLNDKSIMSYVVLNEDKSTYTAYLQSQGSIYLNPDSSYLFYFFSKLESIEGIEYLDSSKVTNMYAMFFRCYSLTNLDLSNFDTSQVTNMSSLFQECNNLTNLDLSSFDTSNVTNMSNMFLLCSSLNSVDIGSFNTRNVKKMNGMFSNCSGLMELDVSGFNTNKVTDMANMFGGCESLTNLDVSSFDTSQVTNMHSMFSDCDNLTSLSLSNFDTSKVTDMSWLFSGCESLTNLDVSSFNTSQVTDMERMFSYCSELANLDLSNFNTHNVIDMSYMFNECRCLFNLNLSSFDTSQVTDMERMFYNCSRLVTTLTIMSTKTSSYSNMFFHSATAPNALITLNYTVETSGLVSAMVRTNSCGSYYTCNVIKGTLVS